jgi:hypothetical protein
LRHSGKGLEKAELSLDGGGRKSSLGPGNKSMIFGLDTTRKNNFMIELTNAYSTVIYVLYVRERYAVSELQVTNSYCSVSNLFYV